ncbi:MarR family winged helix-turn-helix transcriptional regulator [Castellaniella denitrificans]|jgi:DNA-binding MarR family transcriptional regulator|uniref:MarR family winged helix-turn-helix transcriptional regulator n=1 Tax=Castellaniella denitrificans TaxID=56119 RepID=UPI00360E7983
MQSPGTPDTPAVGQPCCHYGGNPTELGADRNIGLLIKHVHTLMHRVIDLKAGPLGLTANQWRPLLLIEHKGVDTPAEMARAMGVDTGAVTRTLDRLESKGFLRRERVPEDRRVVKVVLTDTGREVAARILPAIAETLNIHLQGLSEAEITMLFALLKRMIANGEQHLLQQAAEHPPEP